MIDLQTTWTGCVWGRGMVVDVVVLLVAGAGGGAVPDSGMSGCCNHQSEGWDRPRTKCMISTSTESRGPK